MSIFKWIYEQFNPPKTEDQIYKEQAWNNLKYKQSPEGKRKAEIDKEVREIAYEHEKDVNQMFF